MDLPVTSGLWPFLVAGHALLWGGTLSDSVVAFSQGLPLLDRADICQGLLPRSASLPAPQACPTMLSLHTYQPTMFIQHTCRGAPLGRKVLISHLSLLDLLKLLAVCYLCKLLLLLGSSTHFTLLSSYPVTISSLSFMRTVRFIYGSLVNC